MITGRRLNVDLASHPSSSTGVFMPEAAIDLYQTAEYVGFLYW